MIYILLFEVSFRDHILPLAGGTTIITLILTWIRFRPKDTVDVKKVDAEAAKIMAEAEKVKVEAELTVADAWMKIAQKLTEENDTKGKEVNRMNEIVAALREQLYQTEELLRNANSKLKEVERSLLEEQGKVEAQSQLIFQLRKDIEKLQN